MIIQPTLSAGVQATPDAPPGLAPSRWNSGGSACEVLAWKALMPSA